MPRLFFALFILILACYSCYYDSEEYMYPQFGCDSTNVTFSGSVQPIINSFCVSCHSSSNAIRLDNYAEILVQVNNGKLLGSINHKSGYLSMPQGGSKLDECKLTIISKWVANGASNN
jgi:hypothetical protein